MLNETTLELLSERLVNRIEGANSYILRLIGEQIARIGGMTPTNANRLVYMLKYGGHYDKIARELARISNLNLQEIYAIFEEVAKLDYRFAKQFYDYKEMKYIPYEENYSLQAMVRYLATQTATDYLNLSNTLGFRKVVDGKVVYSSLRDTYLNTINEAILNLNMGTATYQEAMRNTVKELGQSGIRTVNYESGYSRRLDSAVRMNIMDGIRNLHNEMQKVIAEEVGTDGVEISVHENPAEDHKDIQGKQFTNAEFEKLNSELERPISTMNCYHYIFNIIMDVSEPRYSQEELDKINEDNEKGFEFEGKHYTNYEGTQLQRRLETEIRTQKDIHTIAKASGNNELIAESQTKIRQLTKKYKELSDVSGLPTKLERLQVEGFKRANLKELK